MSCRARLAVLVTLLLISSVVVLWRENRIIPVSRPLGSLPLSLGEWRMVSEETFSENVLKNLYPTDYLSRTYRDARGRIASLYVGYHDGGKSGAVHSPRLCLPGSGWNIVEERRTFIKTAGEREIPVVCSVYSKDGMRRMFIYWFRVAGKDVSSIFEFKAREAFCSILESRKDTALVRVDVPVRVSEEDSLAYATAFISSLNTELNLILPGERERLMQ